MRYAEAVAVAALTALKDETEAATASVTAAQLLTHLCSSGWTPTSQNGGYQSWVLLQSGGLRGTVRVPMPGSCSAEEFAERLRRAAQHVSRIEQWAFVVSVALTVPPSFKQSVRA